MGYIIGDADMNIKKSKHNCLIIIILSVLSCAIFLCSCSFGFNFTDSNTKAENELVVHYLDVGQGDSIFIELPNSQTMLIDAGVSGLGEGIVSYINDCGYSKINYLVATHPHADHIGSMAYVVKNIDVGEIYMPKVSTTTRTYEKLLTAISDKGLKIKSAHSGMSIADESDFSIDVLGPVTIDEDSLNNCSVLLKITHHNNKFLFIGDAEKQELSTINADLSADVLKVGHHGSRTSTTEDLLERVDPSIAVISLGKDNDYGHPHKSTINLLNEFDVTTYRTDEDGTIIVTSDGSDITTQTGGKSIEREE